MDYKPRVRVLRAYKARYLIESRTTKGQGHQIDLELKKCSCKAGQNDVLCWHYTMAASLHSWRREQGFVA